MIRLAILALRPFEIYHAWNVRRHQANGRFRRPADYGSGAVTTQPRNLAR